ncbi:kinase-like domain-containing protein [Gautieria morchelliformis]|nr:kinase-like domain-containing protein [Gautieria morchelliformis]
MACVPNHLAGKRVGDNRIELVSLLGEGSYGAVYRALLHRGRARRPKHCAVKVIRTALDECTFTRQHQELEIHRRVSDGAGIVTLYETFYEGHYQYMVMKLCPDRDLGYWIRRNLYLGNDTRIKNIFTQVLDAIDYCHSYGVFHRDIKPENILLCDGGRKALLSDFGLATGNCISTETRTGSPLYMSPECWGAFSVEQSYATAPSDIWSLGILLLDLTCSQKAPWKFAHLHDPFFREFVKQPYLFRFFVPLYSEVHDILSRVFLINPADRISIKELKAAIQRVKHFSIPTGRLTEYYDYQRAAWRAAIAPAPPRPLTHTPTEDRGQDKAGRVCDAKADKMHPRGVRNIQKIAPSVLPDLKAQVQHNTEITTPSLVHPPLSTSPPSPSSPYISSGDLDCQITPQTHAVPDDDAVETNRSDLLQDHTHVAQPAAVPTPSPTHKIPNNKPFISTHFWRDIVDAFPFRLRRIQLAMKAW